jgi:D-alanine-D-alanine ligase
MAIAEAAAADASGKRAHLFYEPALLKKYRLIAVAFSDVKREYFPTDQAYEAEIEVVARAEQVVKAIQALGIDAKGYPGNQYFLPTLLVDKPDLVVNLVDTLRGKDDLQTSVPAALELAGIPYTGAGMQGLVLGNERHLLKQLLASIEVPTPDFQLIRKPGTKLAPELSPPLIVKLNEGGGSVGIDNNAVKETREEAEARADELIREYGMPVVVERFIDGREVTGAVVDDGVKRHVFLAERRFKKPADGKHYYTSFESYDDADDHRYKRIDASLEAKITRTLDQAFVLLRHKDYAKFDIRVDDRDGTPYITDANPNTAFGPSLSLPFTEVLSVHGVGFEQVLRSLLCKHAKRIGGSG